MSDSLPYRRGVGVLTNKRVYFTGKCYEQHGKRWKRVFTEKVVDIKDVTGSGFTHTIDWIPLIISIICFILVPILFSAPSDDGHSGCEIIGIPVSDNILKAYAILILALILCGIISLIVFFVKKIVLFKVEFAGGNISINSACYPQKEAEEFQRKLREVKDVYCKNNSDLNINVRQADDISKGDKIKRLKELNDLLQSGIINDEEFNRLKNEVIEQ
jgi:hypothetical protein